MARLRQDRIIEQTAVIETARLVWRTGRPPMARLQKLRRADDRNRTRLSGVAHRRATNDTASAWRSPGGPDLRTAVDAGARSAIHSWVEWESNPRVGGLRVRCKASICYRPEISESHPLESNQNLSGFNRARRPPTQEWDVCRVRERALASTLPHAAGCVGCLPRHPHRHHSSVVTELPRHAAGAPRAMARSQTLRVHPSRFEISIEIASHKSVCLLSPDPKPESTARNDFGPPGVPWAARSAHDVVHVKREGVLRGGTDRCYRSDRRQSPTPGRLWHTGDATRASVRRLALRRGDYVAFASSRSASTSDHPVKVADG